MRKYVLSILLTVVTAFVCVVIARADVVHLTDGRQIEGEIVKEDDDSVVVKTPLGSVTIPREEIDRIEKKKTVWDEYEKKKKEVPADDATAHYRLALWCKENSLNAKAREHLEQVIELEPDHKEARKLLGYVKEGEKWIKRKKESPKQPRKLPKKGAEKESSDEAKEGKDERLKSAIEVAGANAAELEKALEHFKGKELEGAKFLIARMPQEHLISLSAELLIEHIEYAYLARKKLLWGKSVPKTYFLHYVLPYRAFSSEPVQKWRKLFFDELYPKVKGMTMEQAAVAVNKWAASKAKYDKNREPPVRDWGPLETVKNGYGYCGELSQFYVCAARAVCIPARYVWTPFWTDKDDNHAWAEVFVGKKWRFVEACNPDVGLDQAWWSKHAKKAFIIKSMVFGLPDEVKKFEKTMYRSKEFCVVNVTSNYGETCLLTVEVNHKDGSAAADVRIMYLLVRAQPLGDRRLVWGKTDKDGRVNIAFGRADGLTVECEGQRKVVSTRGKKKEKVAFTID